jgi:hypothetical protein
MGVAKLSENVDAANGRNAQKPRDYADLHVFKSIEAILWQPIVSIGRRTASTARTASARQYGL